MRVTNDENTSCSIGSPSSHPLVLCQPISTSSSSNNKALLSSLITIDNQKLQPDNNDINGNKINTNSNFTTRAASSKTRVYYMYEFLRVTYPSLFLLNNMDTETNGSLTNNDNAPNSRTVNNPQKHCSENRRIILDVAGGKGDLSWFINNLHASPQTKIDSFVIDPRPTNHKSLIKSVRFLESNPAVVQERNVPGLPTFQPLAILLPHLIRQREINNNNNKDRKMKEVAKECYVMQEKGSDFVMNGSVNGYDDSWRKAGSLRIHVDASLVDCIQHCTVPKGSLKQCDRNECDDHYDKNENYFKYNSETFKHWEVYWIKARHRADQLYPSKSPPLPPPTTEKEITTLVQKERVLKKMTCAEYALPDPSTSHYLSHPLRKTNTITSFTATSDSIKTYGTAVEALQIMINAKLIVGFHPDQATEAIVDLAIHLQIPFCIVPCCVFPSEFPHRTIRRQEHPEKKEEVERVRDYDGFLGYLRGKHPKVRVGTLNFPFTKTARNVVLYTLPEDMH